MEYEQKVNINNEDETEIDLLELLFVLRRHLAVILLVAILVAAAVGAFTYFVIPNKYKATAQIYIVSASSESVVNLTDLQIATNLTSDYKELILSRPLMESTIKNLRLQDTQPDDLVKMISVTNPSQTRILYITVESLDPKLSADIANEVARLSLDWLPAIMESNKPNLIQDAVVPTMKSSPSLTKNTAIGFLAGAVLCYGVYVIRYLLDDTIKNADDMEKYFGIVPFASIPEDSSVNDGHGDREERARREKQKGRKR